MFDSGSHFATDFRDIPFHEMFIGLGGYGELVTDKKISNLQSNVQLQVRKLLV